MLPSCREMQAARHEEDFVRRNLSIVSQERNEVGMRGDILNEGHKIYIAYWRSPALITEYYARSTLRSRLSFMRCIRLHSSSLFLDHS